MFLIPPKAHTAYGGFEGNCVKIIKAIKRSFAKYWLCKREPTGEGQPGDVTDLTRPWRKASRARSSLSSAPLTSYPHAVPANAEQQNKIRQAHLPVFSQKKTCSVRGGRKDGTSLEVLLSHMAQGWWGKLFMPPLASGTAQDISEFSPAWGRRKTLKAERSKAVLAGVKELLSATQHPSMYQAGEWHYGSLG